MNIYTHSFYSSCPNNGKIIAYTLEIHTKSRVMVEHIVTRCALHKTGYHEDIADDLVSAFPGEHILKAHHHGVDIETLRSSSHRGPMCLVINSEGSFLCEHKAGVFVRKFHGAVITKITKVVWL